MQQPQNEKGITQNSHYMFMIHYLIATLIADPAAGCCVFLLMAPIPRSEDTIRGTVTIRQYYNSKFSIPLLQIPAFDGKAK